MSMHLIRIPVCSNKDGKLREPWIMRMVVNLVKEKEAHVRFRKIKLARTFEEGK